MPYADSHTTAARLVADAECDDAVGVDADKGVVVAGFRGCARHLLSSATDLDHPHLPRPHREYVADDECDAIVGREVAVLRLADIV